MVMKMDKSMAMAWKASRVAWPEMYLGESLER